MSCVPRPAPYPDKRECTQKVLCALVELTTRACFGRNLSQIVVSPRNYFLFTPLLPSVTVGTLAARSILEPTRFLTRHLKRKVEVYEGEVTSVDPARKTIQFSGAFSETLDPVRAILTESRDRHLGDQGRCFGH